MGSHVCADENPRLFAADLEGDEAGVSGAVIGASRKNGVFARSRRDDKATEKR